MNDNAIMKNHDPNADPPSGEGGEQEVDIGDVDLSAEPVREASRLPPPLPPSASIVPNQPQPVTSMAGSLAPSQASLPPGGSMAPQPTSRSPMFFVGIIVAVLLLSIGGTAIAISRRHAPVVQVQTASASAGAGAAAPAPKVITIGVVEVNDEPDAGP